MVDVVRRAVENATVWGELSPPATACNSEECCCLRHPCEEDVGLLLCFADALASCVTDYRDRFADRSHLDLLAAAGLSVSECDGTPRGSSFVVRMSELVRGLYFLNVGSIATPFRPRQSSFWNRSNLDGWPFLQMREATNSLFDAVCGLIHAMGWQPLCLDYLFNFHIATTEHPPQCCFHPSIRNGAIIYVVESSDQFRWPAVPELVVSNLEYAAKRLSKLFHTTIESESQLKREFSEYSSDAIGLQVVQPDISASPPSCIPSWDRDARTLSFHGSSRKFAPQTGNKVLTLLDAFQEFGWRSREDNPLDSEDAKQALRTLNSNNTLLIRFEKDGEQIAWVEKSP